MSRGRRLGACGANPGAYLEAGRGSESSRRGWDGRARSRYRGLTYSDPYGLCPEFIDGKPCDLNAAASFAAGFGDAVTFGGTNWIRDKIDANGSVDKNGVAYLGGQVAGIAASSALGGAAAQGVDFLVTQKGTAIPVPDGAKGPVRTRAPGIQFTGGEGGKGMDSRVTGVRVMDPNKHSGRRAVFMNEGGHTVSPRTGQQVPPDHPDAHHAIPE